jgi:hypothetical protein
MLLYLSLFVDPRCLSDDGVDQLTTRPALVFVHLKFNTVLGFVKNKHLAMGTDALAALGFLGQGYS